MRAKFLPTDAMRKTVRMLASIGIPQPAIGLVVGCSGPTLRRAFRDDLDHGAIIANAAVAQTCFQMAISGNVPSATFFWLKCRAGWRETAHLERAGTVGLQDMSTTELESELQMLRARRTTVE